MPGRLLAGLIELPGSMDDMSDEQIEHHFQFLRQQILVLQEERIGNWAAMDSALEDLQVLYEQMQVTLEFFEGVQEELQQQKQYYQDQFQFFPIASLITDADGVILEANQTLAQLLNLTPGYLVGKSLVGFVVGGDQPTFRDRLNQLPQVTGTQIWSVNLEPRNRESFGAELHVGVARRTDGQIEHLRIGLYPLSPAQAALAPGSEATPIAPQFLPGVIDPLQQSGLDGFVSGLSRSQVPLPLDGLRVLVVDDEADIREFLTIVLEAQGIGVRAVASAAAALEELERFRPDVLLSDLRMPDEDGYQLIRRIRALEAEQGGHLPAAAITAYLDEDREKSLQAGFEAHLHKLVQPSEWIEMVAQLANQAAR